MSDDTPKLPEPPTEEQVRELAEALGWSFEAARALIGAALLDGTELPNGEIITCTR